MSIIETPLLTGSTNTTAVVTAAGVIPTPAQNVEIPTTVSMSSFRNNNDITPLNFIFTNDGHLTSNGVSLLGRENFQGITVSTTATDLSHLTGENAIQRNMIDMAAIVVHGGHYDHISIQDIQANSRDQNAPIDTTGMEGILLDDFTALNVAACLEDRAACTGYTTRSEALQTTLNAVNERAAGATTQVTTATTARTNAENQLRAATSRSAQTEIQLRQARTGQHDLQTRRNIIDGVGGASILIGSLAFGFFYRRAIKQVSALRRAPTVKMDPGATEQIVSLKENDRNCRTMIRDHLIDLATACQLQDTPSFKNAQKADIPTDSQLKDLLVELKTYVAGNNISNAHLKEIVTIVNSLVNTLGIVDQTQSGYKPVTTTEPLAIISLLKAIASKIQPSQGNVGKDDQTVVAGTRLRRGANDPGF